MSTYVIQGLCNQWEETTMFVAEGHDVPLDAIREYAKESEDWVDEFGIIADPRNVYARWEPVTDPEGAWGTDTMRFVVCEKDHHHSEPYTVCKVEESHV
jgi:hypothetical protein